MLLPRLQQQQGYSTGKILMCQNLDQECFLHMPPSRSAHSSQELFHSWLQELWSHPPPTKIIKAILAQTFFSLFFFFCSLASNLLFRQVENRILGSLKLSDFLRGQDNLQKSQHHDHINSNNTERELPRKLF